MSERLHDAQTAYALQNITDGSTLILGGGTPTAHDLDVAETIIDSHRTDIGMALKDGTLCIKTVTPHFTRIILTRDGVEVGVDREYQYATNGWQYCNPQGPDSKNCTGIDIRDGHPIYIRTRREELSK